MVLSEDGKQHPLDSEICQTCGRERTGSGKINCVACRNALSKLPVAGKFDTVARKRDGP